MAQGDFIILSDNRKDNRLKSISSQLASTRTLLELVVDSFANMDVNQINTYYGTQLVDEAARTQLVNQFTAARDALQANAIDNIIDYIG